MAQLLKAKKDEENTTKEFQSNVVILSVQQLIEKIKKGETFGIDVSEVEVNQSKIIHSFILTHPKTLKQKGYYISNIESLRESKLLAEEGSCVGILTTQRTSEIDSDRYFLQNEKLKNERDKHSITIISSSGDKIRGFFRESQEEKIYLKINYGLNVDLVGRLLPQYAIDGITHQIVDFLESFKGKFSTNKWILIEIDYEGKKSYIGIYDEKKITEKEFVNEINKHTTKQEPNMFRSYLEEQRKEEKDRKFVEKMKESKFLKVLLYLDTSGSMKKYKDNAENAYGKIEELLKEANKEVITDDISLNKSEYIKLLYKILRDKKDTEPIEVVIVGDLLTKDIPVLEYNGRDYVDTTKLGSEVKEFFKINQETEAYTKFVEKIAQKIKEKNVKINCIRIGKIDSASRIMEDIIEKSGGDIIFVNEQQASEDHIKETIKDILTNK